MDMVIQPLIEANLVETDAVLNGAYKVSISRVERLSISLVCRQNRQTKNHK
jgi:hypothetical protein